MPDYFQGLTQGWIWLISSLGGVAAFKEDFNKDDQWKTHILKFTWRMTISAFAGAIGFLASVAGELGAWSPVVTGLMAWRGPKGLEAAANIAETVGKETLSRLSGGRGTEK